MVYHLVHALVLTPFEASVPAQTWEEVAATDYPIHTQVPRQIWLYSWHVLSREIHSWDLIWHMVATLLMVHR